ncbi:MAG TPA: hypothetical protein ENN87_10115 [Phycisphaerales bacterium]|nr:hypothetical protein [Phycisphaerales bacterium]
MKKTVQPIAWLAVLLLVAFAAPSVSAAESSPKPFAEKRVVLQMSDEDPFKQTLVLNVANNLIKHYGPDKVDIEIVAFGPGLRLLFADNANKGRIGDLSQQGVRFAACENTIANMSRILGGEPALNANAVRVSAGVVRILDLEGEGYTLIRP